MPISTKIYNFISADEGWTVALARDFVGLSTTAYQRWEEFSARTHTILSMLTQEYSPSFYSRIGLRYQNIVWRSKLNVGDVQWPQLLKPHILGELGAADVASEVKQSYSEALIALDRHGASVQIRHGLVEENEVGYMIDSDFYTDTKVELNDAARILDFFHGEAQALFRWCITDDLHNALEPTTGA
jgi:uncharacterized protein (TIGR04255 family)